MGGSDGMNAKQFPRGILMDLDDTVVDEGRHMQACWNTTCARAGVRLGVPPKRLFKEIAEKRDWFWSDPERHREGRLDLLAATTRIVYEALEELGFEEPIEAAQEIAYEYRAMREERVDLFPDAVETLEGLRERGARLALMTNGGAEAQWRKIRRFDLEQHFDCIIVEGEFGVGKPERAVYEHALKTLDVAPEEAWSVGDSLENDVGGPQALGVFGIWHDHRRQGLPEGSAVKPDRIVHSLGELLDGG
jgi:putative hydrolase of the HAD superfamily